MQKQTADKPLTNALTEQNNNSNGIFDANDTIEALHNAVHFQPLHSKPSTPSDINGLSKTMLLDVGAGATATVAADDADLNEPMEPYYQGISLKDFEQHRKLIEEQNKQKKEMLTKAIEQR